MRRISSILVVAAASMIASAASADMSAIVAEMAEKILDKGYGETCSLEMVPVRSGGYYPCFDFGPYRVVKEYGRVSGYVVREGKPPYLVMTGGERGSGFVTPGPWETDMAARIVSYWNDVIEGGAERLKQQAQKEAERREVEAYIRKLNETPSASVAGEPPKEPSQAIESSVGSTSSSVAPNKAGGGIVEAIAGG